MGFVKEQCFPLLSEVELPWRDSERCTVLVSSCGGSDICRNIGGCSFLSGETAMAMERLDNFSDEATERRGMC